jgi:hypothetical protein
MFEKEIKFIIDFTLNRIKKLGSFFTIEKLASAEIHPAIILYISNNLDYLIYKDRKMILQNSSFDYSGTEIAKYFNLISEEIKKNRRLALEDVKTLLSHAVTFNINFLVRPNWTLIKLIFDESKTRNVNEIRMMLNYLYYYDYVRNVFHGYFSKRKILSLSETEFGLILNKIDKQMFSEHTNDLIDNALVSIAEFFNEGGLNKTRISTQTIEMFLKEKNLMEPLFKLRRSIPAEDKGKFDIEDIRKILYSKEPVKIQSKKDGETAGEITTETKKQTENLEVEEETKSEDKTGEDEVISKEPEKEVETLREENIPEKEKTPDTESPSDFLSRYESELKSLEELEEQLNDMDKEDLTLEDFDKESKEIIPEPESKESPPSEEIITDKPGTGSSDESDKAGPFGGLIIEEEEINAFSEDERITATGSEAGQEHDDILKFLSDKDMERIISNVFNEDEEDFVNTMEKIANSNEYDDATEILKAVFSSYKVSPYSKDAVTLTNAVSNFFNQD